MRSDALAKSHRPVKALFRSDRTPVVGAGAQGELIVAVTPDALNTIARGVEGAEEETRYKAKPNKDRSKPAKQVPNPSRPRSEIGAIEELALWNANDRRQFSVQQAIAWLGDPRAGGFYLVELFKIPPNPSDWDALDVPERHLFQSFRSLVINFGTGIRAVRLPLLASQRAVFAIWLTEGATTPEIYWEPLRVTENNPPTGPIDLNIGRHRRLLALLDEHPLVKRIHLPPIVERNSVPAAQVAQQPRTWHAIPRVEGAR
jgi:hypothetical protein